MKLKKIFLLLMFSFIINSVCSAVSAETVSAAHIVNEEIRTQTQPMVPFLNNSYRNSRIFVGARTNPYYKVDCKKSSKAYDPYYCGLRNQPEVVRFSTPRAGITFTF